MNNESERGEKRNVTINICEMDTTYLNGIYFGLFSLHFSCICIRNTPLPFSRIQNENKITTKLREKGRIVTIYKQMNNVICQVVLCSNAAHIDEMLSK